ncbi:uncharacterized protein K452DRAFT_308695 [Neofusicoccum parvum]|nr:uncharacterized protein K452DRAFT_308695 [Neofusicoccum parvum]
MSLNDLPDELLDDVLNYIDPSPEGPGFHGAAKDDNEIDGFPALLSLNMVSKRFRRLTEPRIYNAYSHTHGQDGLRRLLRTLVRRPDLAAAVRRVDMSEAPFDPPKLPPAEHVDELVAAARPLPIDSHERFLDALKDGDEHAEATLLLLLCHNLRALAVDVDHPSETTHLSALFHAAIRAQSPPHPSSATPTPLAALTSLSIINTGLTLPRTLLNTALTLPSLRHLHITNLGHDPYPSPWPAPPPPSPLSHLTLHNTSTWRDDVATLAARCAALSSLAIHMGPSNARFPHPALAAILRRHAPSLEHLSLDLAQWTAFNAELGDRPRLPPLRFAAAGPLPRLRVLEVAGALLVGDGDGDGGPRVAVLVAEVPGSVEVLRVVGAPAGCAEYLREVGERCRGGGWPRMRRVEVLREAGGGAQVGEEVLERLRPGYAEAGVVLVWGRLEVER